MKYSNEAVKDMIVASGSTYDAIRHGLLDSHIEDEEIARYWFEAVKAYHSLQTHIDKIEELLYAK